MKLTADKLTIISKGSNSSIYTYGENSLKLALKVVPVSCSKEVNHLKNEYEILKKIDDEGIIKVSMFK